MGKLTRPAAGVAVALVLLIAGCAGYQPGDGRTRVDEVPSGPGLFTGEKGAFYIVGGPEKRKDSDAR